MHPEGAEGRRAESCWFKFGLLIHLQFAGYNTEAVAELPTDRNPNRPPTASKAIE